MWGSRYFSSACMSLKELAPRRGLEPLTFRLTAERSTIELSGSAQAALGGSLTKAPNSVKEAHENEKKMAGVEAWEITDQARSDSLLNASDASVKSDQGIKNGEHVATVFHHAFEHFAQAWFALSLPVPASQNTGRHFDIAAELFGRMAAQKQAIKECCFPLRVFKLPQSLLADDELLGHTRKRRKRSLPKVLASSRGRK